MSIWQRIRDWWAGTTPDLSKRNEPTGPSFTVRPSASDDHSTAMIVAATLASACYEPPSSVTPPVEPSQTSPRMTAALDAWKTKI